MVEKPAVHTTKQFCEAYGIRRTKMYEEINSGRLKAKKLGSKTLILASAAEAWYAALPDWKVKT